MIRYETVIADSGQAVALRCRSAVRMSHMPDAEFCVVVGVRENPIYEPLLRSDMVRYRC
jgi:hypothetical protein